MSTSLSILNLKLDNPPVVAAQGTAFEQRAPIKEARKEDPSPRSITVMPNGRSWALNQTKIINERKMAMDDADDEKSAASAKSSKSIKSLTKTMEALEKDNWRLMKSGSALQKCDEDEDDDSS
jgi:hypothetical protein